MGAARRHYARPFWHGSVVRNGSLRRRSTALGISGFSNNWIVLAMSGPSVR
jgi:hypothetical protein